MKVYECKLNKDNQGVLAISAVQNGAMQESFVKLSKDDRKRIIKLSSDEQQMVYSAVLVPDRLVYRSAESMGGEEAYIKFSADTIKDVAVQFMGSDDIHAATLEHDGNECDKFQTVESWIIDDAACDKAVSLGFEDLPAGTWMMGRKVLDVELWNEIKEGTYDAFSIEGKFDMNLTFSQDKIITEKDLNDIIKSL